MESARCVMVDQLNLLEKKIGEKVRVTGRIVNYDMSESRATLQGIKDITEITINTRLVEPFSCNIGCLCQVLGEVEEEQILAHVVRNVDTLDLVMYEAALYKQETFLKNRTGHNM